MQSPDRPIQGCAAHPRRRWVRAGLALLALGLGAGPAAAQAIRVTSSEGRVPEYHVVAKGDTLWGICEQYFEDPWRWPNVWALNPHVTNPHYIYPRDVVRLRLGDSLPGTATRPTAYTVGMQTAALVVLNEGFIEEEELETLGTIHRSPVTRRYLSEDDPVYLRVKKLDEARIGDRFSVVRIAEDVIHPETDELLGRKVQVTGIAEIESVEEHIAKGVLIRSFSEIERGMRLVPLQTHAYVVSPRQNLVELKGTVVDTLHPIQEIGQFHTVFLDRGEKDGVQVGNRFFVQRQGDGYLDLSDSEVEKLPWEQIGEALVVRTQDRNSTAIITRSALEIRRGDRVTMIRHY